MSTYISHEESATIKTHHKHKVSLDDDDFKHGDLGLGKGLKPGSLTSGDPHITHDRIVSVKVHRQPSIAHSRTESVSSFSSDNSDSELSAGEDDNDDFQSQPTKLSQFFNRRSSKNSSRSMLNSECDEQFPSYANVSYGTSIRQQKRLFEHDLEKIINKNLPLEEMCTGGDCMLCSGLSSPSHLRSPLSIEIEHRLYKAKLEINELHIELENCRQRLESKYQAIDILRKQAECCEDEYEFSEQKASDYSHQLEKEINSLQFNLHHKESMLESSEEVWTERFDRHGHRGR